MSKGGGRVIRPVMVDALAHLPADDVRAAELILNSTPAERAVAAARSDQLAFELYARAEHMRQALNLIWQACDGWGHERTLRQILTDCDPALRTEIAYHMKRAGYGVDLEG